MKIRFVLLLLLCALSTQAAPIPTVHDVRTFGAIGDGTTFNTAALQAAIDQCNKDCGGTAVDAANILDELTPENRKGRWPEYSRFSRAGPSFGLYAHHAKGLTVRNAGFGTLAADERPPVVFRDVSDPKLSDTLVPTASPP